MTPEQMNQAYFNPIQVGLYLFAVVVFMTVYYQRKWAKRCKEFVRVILRKPDGSTAIMYAPKMGGSVSIKDPNSNTVRLWPISVVCAIEMDYPGDGFIPLFLQRKIKTVIVSEDDLEPLLNNGSYVSMVASPDVVRRLRIIAESLPEFESDGQPTARDALTALTDRLTTAPTRELIASPAVLGNIMNEKVSEMAVTISKESLDRLDAVTKLLQKMPNAMILYLGIIAIVIMLVIVLFKTIPALGQMQLIDWESLANDFIKIKGALGIK